MHSGTVRFLVLVAAACLVWAYGCGDGQPSTFAVTDSAGVEIVTSRSPAWGEGAGWTLSPEPILSIGVQEGDPHYQFYYAGEAHRFPDGRIVVVNQGTRQLRFYGPDGTWIRDAGREGGGPGEFRQINTMMVVGDSIWVSDGGLRRLTLFEERGGYVRSTGFGDGDFAGLLADGRRILTQRIGSWMVNPKDGPYTERLRYLLVGPDGTVVKELGEFDGSSFLVQVLMDRVRSMGMVWGRQAFFTTTADGFVYGSGGRYRVLDYDAEGGLRRIVRLDRAPEPTGPAALAAWMDSAADRSDDPAATRQSLREHYDGVDLPAAKPTWTDIRVGARGDLWLKRYSDINGVPQRWTVFNADGVWLGDVTMPERFELYQVGEDFLLGVARDEMDVQRVRLYSLNRRAPEDRRASQ